MKFEIETKAGRIHLSQLDVVSVRGTGDEARTWLTSYSLEGEIVREDRRESPPELDPAKLLLQIHHYPATCGIAIAAEYWHEGELVRRDIAVEVYDPPSMTSGVG